MSRCSASRVERSNSAPLDVVGAFAFAGRCAAVKIVGRQLPPKRLERINQSAAILAYNLVLGVSLFAVFVELSVKEGFCSGRRYYGRAGQLADADGFRIKGALTIEFVVLAQRRDELDLAFSGLGAAPWPSTTAQ